MSNELLKNITQEINQKIVRSHITNFLVINTVTFIFVSSYLKREKLLISLEPNNPHINFLSLDETPLTINNGLSLMARHYIKDSYVLNVEVINNDKIIKFSLRQRVEENIYKDYFVYIELINKHTNFIITDENNKILLATRYSSKDSKRKILVNQYYELPENIEHIFKEENIENYKKETIKIYDQAIKKRRKEKFGPLYNFISKKVNVLSKKEKVLLEEINSGKDLMNLKDFGDYCLYMSSEEVYALLNESNIKFDPTLNLKELSSYFYKQYKRGKSKITFAKEQLEKCKEELTYYLYLKESITKYSEEELDSLSFDLLKTKKDNRKTDKIKGAKNPYMINALGTQILFGKNAEQNQHLTFHIAKENHTFVHIHNYPGSHIIIKNDNPSKEQILLAASLALLLSFKTAGEILIAKVKDVKSTSTTGLVNVKKYSIIKINNVNNDAKNCLKNAAKM